LNIPKEAATITYADNDGCISTSFVDPYWEFDSTAWSNGSYLFTYIMYDSSGRVSNTAFRTLTISNANPVVNLTSPADGATISGRFTLSGTAIPSEFGTASISRACLKINGSVPTSGYYRSYSFRSYADSEGCMTTPFTDPYWEFDVTDWVAGNYTFSFYVYMNDLSSPSFAPSDDMRYHKIVELTGACSIYMDPVQQSAQIVLNPATPSGAGLPSATLTIPNFLTSRWNQLAFTVEGRTIDCYLNGALVTSTLLPDVPRSVPTQITLYPMAGFTGQLGYVQIWPRRLTLPEMTANYKQTSDPRGKPYIPAPGTSLSDLLAIFSRGFCSLGLCIDPDNTNPLRSIDYLYA
jgi:hypothetical protein